MQFNHNLFNEIQLTSHYDSAGRIYVTPDGTSLPSVTTVIGRMQPKDQLIAWRKRVGEIEANAITQKAAKRGSIIHEAAEKYILNDPLYASNLDEENTKTFKELASVLDDNVGTIYGIEIPLFSKTLWTAGRSDLIADWQGTMSIVDFKTSLKPKRESYITNYFLQSTAYAYMASIMYQLAIKQIVIVIAVDNQQPQVFIKKTSEFLDEMVSLFKKHKQIYCR